MTPAKDISDVIASSHLLLTELQLLGAGYYPDVVRKQSELETKACSLCGDIKQLLSVCKEEYIPDLLDCYILLHSIASRQPLSQSVITAQLQRLFKTWQSGNKDISESDLYALITLSLRTAASQPLSSVAFTPLTDEQLLTFLSLRDNWLTTLHAHNYFPEVTTYENYRRLTLLTEEPTGKGEEIASVEEKLRWYHHNRIEDLSILSIPLLTCYRRYILSLPPAVLDFEQRTEQDTTILNELLRRKDLHPLDRKAYSLSIEYNRLLLDD